MEHHSGTRRVRRHRLLAPLTVAALLIVGAAACTFDDDAESASSTLDAASLTGKTYLSTPDSPEQVPGGGRLTLTVDDNGRLSLYAGCNRHSAQPTFDGDQLTLTALASTMMACLPPTDRADEWITDFVAKPLTWTLDGRKLTLTRDGRTVVLAEQVPRPVANTTWRVTALVRKQGVESSRALDEAKPTLRIGDDSTVHGFTGCNQMTGEAVITKDQLVTFGPIATTRKACEPAVMQIESAILAVLTGEVTATVTGDQLALTNVTNPAIALRLSATTTEGDAP